MIALVISLGLRALGLTPFNTRDWILSALLLLAVESFLWLIPHLGWDEDLRWDPSYIRLPMIVAAVFFALFTYIDPAARVLILMLWFVGLMFLVGRAGFWDVAALSTLNAGGYVVAVAARRAQGWSISLPFEAATAGCFLITCFYVGFFFERLRREHAERRAFREKLVDLAVTDALTTLPNRRHFEGTLRTELARIERYGGQCSVVMIDVDRFKNFNDRLGHLAGDDLLRELSSLIRRSLRRGDGAARYGGEEFALIMTNTGKTEGLEVLER